LVEINESTDTIQELLNKTTLPKLLFSKRGDKLFEIEEVKDKSFPRTDV
jgi:hypothetical protein